MILHFLNPGGGSALQFLNLSNPKNALSVPSSSFSVRCVSELACNGLPVHDVAAILHNKVLVSAVVSGAIGQLTKPFASTILYGNKFDLKTCLGSGGFPSTHSSSVVATATCLGIERGFTDAVFGLAVVYAGLIMYDAQGVRREVGTHARVLNKVMPSTPPSKNDLVNSYSREMADPVLSEENGSSLLVKAAIRLGGAVLERESSGISESVASSSLKESIGHTEVEVAAGALLGLVVSLVICTYL